MRYRLGKRPARPGAVGFRLARYADFAALPVPPPAIGHAGLIGMTGWDVLANDRYGDCVWAGAAHETMLFNAIAGRKVRFSDDNVLMDYSAATGFNAADPATDQGTDMTAAASYRRKTGVIDAAGTRHTIAAYLALDVERINAGDLGELALALYLFGAAGIGLQLPASALEATDRGAMWEVVADSAVVGGHYVPGVGRLASGFWHAISWGAVQTMTAAFLIKYCDEAIAYVSKEFLVEQKSPEGFDYATLIADLGRLAA